MKIMEHMYARGLRKWSGVQLSNDSQLRSEVATIKKHIEESVHPLLTRINGSEQRIMKLDLERYKQVEELHRSLQSLETTIVDEDNNSSSRKHHQNEPLDSKAALLSRYTGAEIQRKVM